MFVQQIIHLVTHVSIMMINSVVKNAQHLIADGHGRQTILHNGVQKMQNADVKSLVLKDFSINSKPCEFFLYDSNF